MSDRNIARRFFQAWRLFQERYRVVAKSYSSNISLLELSILIETQIQTGRSRAELARLFSVSQQTVSSAARRLLEQGYLSEVQTQDDARRWDISLTQKGARELRGIDREANEILERMSAHLPKRELKRLILLWGRMQSHFSNELAAVREIDNPLRGPIRTFTRGFGLLGRSAFGVNAVSTLEWHLLSAMNDTSGGVYLVDLATRFHCKKNSLSMLLSRMEERGLISRQTKEGADRRKRLLQLEAEGKSLLREIELRGEKLSAAALNRLSRPEQEELCELFERFVGASEVEYQFHISVKIRRLPGPRGSSSELSVFVENGLFGHSTVPSTETSSKDEVLRHVLRGVQPPTRFRQLPRKRE